MYKKLFKATVERSDTSDLDLVADTIESVGRCAFAYATFRNIILRNVTAVTGISAFEGTKIFGDTISFPNLVSADQFYLFANSTFYGGTISMPKLTRLPSNAFYQMCQRSEDSKRPTAIFLDSVSEILSSALYNCYGVYRVFAPRCVSISGSSTFLSFGRQFCGPDRRVPADECALIVGSADLGSGMSMASLTGSADFPFGAAQNQYSPTWYCKDGTVTYDTAQGAWVQTPYS